MKRIKNQYNRQVITLSICVIICLCFTGCEFGGKKVLDPRDIPIYPNAQQIQHTSGYDANKNPVDITSFVVVDSVQTVRDYYIRTLQSLGWQLATQQTLGPSNLHFSYYEEKANGKSALYVVDVIIEILNGQTSVKIQLPPE
jgi:hypothetical protein